MRHWPKMPDTRGAPDDQLDPRVVGDRVDEADPAATHDGGPVDDRGRRVDLTDHQGVTAAEIRAAFTAERPFPLDQFQSSALDALDAGRSVLVAAPTGSGKTLVAEYAIARALAEGTKAFYTTPLKALSNQKYGDFVRAYGTDRVGLLTGDNAINGDAPIVVMTTEVLRNMIYAGSDTLHGLRYVVLDEVHYLQDRSRGAVWEEVIIHLPAEIDIVALSATVSNAEEVAAWMQTVRGATETVIEERRPVDLVHLYLVGDRGAPSLHLLPTFVDDDGESRPNPVATRLDGRNVPDRGQRRRRLYKPWRTEVVERLAEERMLPAIAFVFSRTGCDQAVEQCLASGIRLTNADERRALPRDRGATRRVAVGRRPRRVGLRHVARGDGGGDRRAPRRAGAADEGGGRGGILDRPAEGRVRDRDARARHQHARPFGRDREAVEVHRRAPRVPDPGGVHPARGPGRPAGDRRRRLRGRALGSVRAVRPGRRARLAAHLRADLVVPPDVQHGRQPGAALPAPAGAPPPQPVVRAVPRRSRRRRGRARPRAAARAPRQGRSRGRASGGRHPRVPPAPRRARRGPARPAHAEPTGGSSPSDPATCSSSPSGAARSSC